MRYLLSVQTGRTPQVFKKILDFFVTSKEKIILDLTCGKGLFYRLVHDRKIIQSDIRRIEKNPNQTILADCRKPPFRNATFDVIVLDPPFQFGRGRKKSEFTKRYSSLKDVDPTKKPQDALLSLFHEEELYQLLKKDGILIIKMMDFMDNRQYWNHMRLEEKLRSHFYLDDLIVYLFPQKPILFMSHWKKVVHARKNHSFFMIFRKRKAI